jgi:hypothetical protein
MSPSAAEPDRRTCARHLTGAPAAVGYCGSLEQVRAAATPTPEHQVFRITAAFVLLQLLAQVTGFVHAADEMGCEETSSERDGRDRDCTPGCEECLC